MTDADTGSDGKLSLEEAQKNWQDLSPDEMARAMAAVETLQKITDVLPTLTAEQKTAVRIQQEADKQRILKAGRRKADATESVEVFHESRKTANSGRVNLVDMMANPPEGYEPRVWSPYATDGGALTQVLMRKGQIGSLAGPDKGGKTRIAVSLMNALLDPSGDTLFLNYYKVEPLKPWQVVVHIALEEDEADMFAAWGPYLRENPNKGERVIAISYSGVNVNLLAEEIRHEVSKDIYEQLFEMGEHSPGQEYEIGAVIIDPLFAMAQGDYNKDPRLATDVFNSVLKAWCKDQMGAEIVLVLAHTSREGGKMGGEGSIYGSIGWASKMHFLWYVQKDQKRDDYRIFGANRGRADTYGFPQRLYMLTEEDGEGQSGRLEVRPEEMAEAAAERSNGRAAATVKAPSKTKVLRDKLEEMLVRHATSKPGEPLLARVMHDALESEAVRTQEAGLPVPFLYDKTAISKVLKIITADGQAEVMDWTDPDRPGKLTHGWKWRDGAVSTVSLTPPSPAARKPGPLSGLMVREGFVIDGDGVIQEEVGDSSESSPVAPSDSAE